MSCSTDHLLSGVVENKHSRYPGMSVPMGYDAKDKLFNLKVLLGVNDIIAEGLSSKISSRRNELQKCQALNRLVVAKVGGRDKSRVWG